MAAHYIDSFGFYSQATHPAYRYTALSGANLVIDPVGTSQVLYLSGSTPVIKYPLVESGTYVSVHMDVRIPPGQSNVFYFPYLNDDTNRAVTFNTDGSVTWMGQTTSTGLWIPSSWNNVNLYINAGANGNNARLVINGRSRLLTTNNNLTLITSILIGNQSATGHFYLKNLYVRTRTTTDGDFSDIQCPYYFRVGWMVPSSDNSVQWTPNGAATNWQAVTGMSTGTYVSNPGLGVRDVYDFTDTPNHISVSSIQDSMLFDSAANVVSGVILQGFEYAWNAGTSAVPKWTGSWYATNPTGGPWSKTGLDAFRAGQKI